MSRKPRSPALPNPPDALLFAPAVAQIIGLPERTFRDAWPAMVKQEGFPRPITISTSPGRKPSRRWWRSAVESWKARQLDAAPKAHPWETETRKALACLRAPSASTPQ